MGEDGWGDEGDVFEADAVVAALHDAVDVGEGVGFRAGAAGWVVGGGVDAVEGADEGVDAGGVAGELRQVFDAVHHAAAGVGEGEHETLVRYEGLHAGLRGVLGLG